MSYGCGPADWIDLAVGRLEDAKRSLRERDRLRHAATGVQVYCPDNGGALRLTYDLRMQAAKSLREDSTLCLLWAMLMDSYSRWRTTWDVFNETGESYDL